MIPYRPIAPLALGPQRGWKSVVGAVALAALLGTATTSAVAAETSDTTAAIQSSGSAEPGPSVRPTELTAS